MDIDLFTPIPKNYINLIDESEFFEFHGKN